MRPPPPENVLSLVFKGNISCVITASTYSLSLCIHQFYVHLISLSDTNNRSQFNTLKLLITWKKTKTVSAKS